MAQLTRSFVCLAVVVGLSGCTSPPEILPAVNRSASGPRGLRAISHQRRAETLEIQPGGWRPGYRMTRSVQVGELYEVRLTSQVTSEAPQVKVECRLRVGQQLIGSGVAQSVSQPMETGGNHHSPLTALGLWTPERSGQVEFLAEFRAEPLVPTTQKVYLDAHPTVPYGHLSLICWGSWPSPGLDAVFTEGSNVKSRPGQVPGLTRGQYLDVWRWPLQAQSGDSLLLFAQTWARHKREDEIEPYQRLYPQFDGEQVFTSLSLDGEPAADLHGENLCSQHPELQAFQEMAVGPLTRGVATMQLQVCGAYGRGSWLSEPDTRGFALRFRPACGAPLQEIREWKVEGPTSGSVRSRPGDWLTLAALVQCEDAARPLASTRVDLRLGDQRVGAQRTLGAGYRYGYLRLEAVCRAAGPETLWSLSGPVRSGYFLMRRWSLKGP